MLDTLTRDKCAFLVAVAEDHQGGERVVGFADFAGFRWGKTGYHQTVENTVHVHPDERNRGIGTLLMRELIAAAQLANMHTMVAFIDSSNEGSVRFHERLGFEHCGVLREVGRLRGEWLSSVTMQLML
jgi:phosphinothricin acetyltransferase